MGEPGSGLSRSLDLSRGRFEERYEIGEPLGAGGMGEVLVCHDRLIGRDVALKVMRDEHAGNPELATRFLREARIQGQLEHPAVVPVYDLGVRGDGSIHFTMKRVAGRTVRQLLDAIAGGAAYDRRALLGALSRVCIAVAYAHERGVVHRDLKPANVILGDFGEVYVLDWGVAKLVEHEEVLAPRALLRDSLPDSDLAETRVGALLGTPEYMAPEQLRGEPVDERADVYALGAMLFEVLALRPLHENRALGDGDPSPRRRAPELEVPAELDALVVRATAPAREERLDSALELHRALEAFLDLDGDVERRRELAREHARAADEALERAEADPEGVEHRLRALFELNRARALDPANAGALAALLRVMAELPARLPAEVESELSDRRIDDRARSSRRSALAYLAIAGILVWIALDVARAAAPVWVSVGLSLATAAHAWVFAAERTRFVHFFANLLGKTLVTASLCVLFGPLLLVPGVMLAVALVVIVHQRASSRLRWTIVSVSMAAMLLPLAASYAGLLPHWYAAAGGVFSVHPWAIELTPAATYGVLAIGAAMSLLVPIVLVGRSVDDLARAERHFAAQAWYLKALVAGGRRAARPASEPPAPAPPAPVSRVRRAADPEAPTRAADSRALAETVLALSSAPGSVHVDDVPAPARGEPAFSGRYRVEDMACAEGTDEVRRCRDLWIGREVALRTSEQGLVDRFVREARIQARLEHPAVLPVYDIGVREDGVAFFTMKRALGSTLAEILERLRAGDAAAELRYGRRALLGALARVCIALAYAHSRGVVHRNLTPDRVVLGQWDDVYVLGWGVAKLLGRPDPHAAPPDWQIRDSLVDTGDAADTGPGGTRRTTAFTAPEQELGHEVDARADVYALGTMLRELLSVGGEIPPELASLSERATARDPARRLATARELHDRLMRYLDGQRDSERRAEIVSGHLAEAERTLERAHARGVTPEGIALRSAALGELNAALALDPAHRGAYGALVALLEDVPERPPRDVEQELAAANREERRRAARRATIGYAAIFASVCGLAVLGERPGWPIGAILVASAAAGAHTWVFGPARGRKLHVVLSLLLSAATVASLSALFGPLVLAPTIALAMAVTVIVHSRARPRVRWMVLASYALALIAPALLELAGALPPSYALSEGMLRISMRAVELGELGATTLLVVATALSLAVPTLLVGRSIDALGSAERRQAAQVWLLRRSLPERS